MILLSLHWFNLESSNIREAFCRMNSMLVCGHISFWRGEGGTYLVSGGALAGPGYDPDVSPEAGASQHCGC